MKNILKLLFLIKILIFSSTNAIYAQSWIKATTLNNGDTIVFVCESAKVELSGFNKTNGKATSYTDSPKGLYKFKVFKNDSEVNFQSCENQNLFLIGTNINDSDLGLNFSKNYWNVEFENNTTILKYYYNKDVSRYLRYYTEAATQAFRMYDSNSLGNEVSIYVAKYDKKSRNLHFESLEYTTDLNETFVSPILKGETQGVTYSSSNKSVATVDPVTGHVTIKSTGTTTIKAQAPASDSYYEGEASYTLNVTDNTGINTFTINFTNKEKLKNWGITLPQKGGNSSALPTLYDNEVKLTFTHGTSTQTSIYNSNNNYSLRLYKGGGSVTFNVPDAYEITEIIINGDGLLNGNFPQKESYDNKKTSWKGNAQSITYASSNDGGTCIINTIKITYKPCTTRPTSKKVKISTNGLATFSSAHSWIVPEELVAATATANGEILHLKKSYWPGDIIPPYTGVILLGEAGEYTLEAPTNNETGNEEINNDLRAAVTNLKINADENCKLYILANDPTHGIGFYFQGTNNDGTYVQHIAEKAYLQLPNSSNISCLRLQLTPTTSIETNLHHTQQKQIYNLEGKLIKPVDLRNGLYIVNGKIQYITK